MKLKTIFYIFLTTATTWVSKINKKCTWSKDNMVFKPQIGHRPEEKWAAIYLPNLLYLRVRWFWETAITIDPGSQEELLLCSGNCMTAKVHFCWKCRPVTSQRVRHTQCGARVGSRYSHKGLVNKGPLVWPQSSCSLHIVLSVKL